MGSYITEEELLLAPHAKHVFKLVLSTLGPKGIILDMRRS